MVMAGENAANDVNEEVCGNDGAERHEAQEASAGDRRAIADADQAGQLDISGETNTARTLRPPEPPTDAARMAHNATHVPFRDWCPFCVASRGRSSPHRRVVVKKTADTLPMFQTEYIFVRTGGTRMLFSFGFIFNNTMSQVLHALAPVDTSRNGVRNRIAPTTFPDDGQELLREAMVGDDVAATNRPVSALGCSRCRFPFQGCRECRQLQGRDGWQDGGRVHGSRRPS